MSFTAPLTWPLMHIRHAACKRKKKRNVASSNPEGPCVCFARAESCGDDVAPATAIVIDCPIILLWLSQNVAGTECSSDRSDAYCSMEACRNWTENGGR